MFSKLKPQCHFKRKEATLTPTAECLIRFALSIFVFNNFNQKEPIFFLFGILNLQKVKPIPQLS